MNRRVGPAAVAAMAAALTLTACGSSNDNASSGSSGGSGSSADASTKKLVIGDILFDADAYQIAQQKQMQRYADSLGIKMVFENQKGQGTAAPNLMDDLLAKGVDGIIFQPADANVATPLVRAAQAKKIPVLGWAIPFNPEVTAPYIGLDEKEQAFAAGKRAAQYVQKNMPGKPVKALIVTITGVSICKDVRMGPFEQGVKSVAPSASFTTINGAGDRNKAVTVTEDALQRDKDFTIATGCNSDMSMGALQAFKSAGLGAAAAKKPDHTYFYSINGTDEELRALTDPGSPVMEVLGLTPKEVAKTLIDTTVKMIKGQIDPNSTYTTNVPDKPLSTDCASVNTFNKDEYLASKDLPCVGS
jgi:ABC-type sugar transport system substrate-binding protein